MSEKIYDWDVFEFHHYLIVSVFSKILHNIIIYEVSKILCRIQVGAKDKKIELK